MGPLGPEAREQSAPSTITSAGPVPDRSNAIGVPSFDRAVCMVAPLMCSVFSPGGDVLGLEQLPDFELDVTVLAGPPLDPRDRLFLRFRLDHRETCDELLRLGERAVCHGSLAAGDLHARALGAGLKPRAVEHDTGF